MQKRDPVTLRRVRDCLNTRKNQKKARILQRFFKTGPGEYAEGDLFLGITVPAIRQLAKQFQDLPLCDIQKLLSSGFHEERLLALLLLISQYCKGEEARRKEIYELYLANTRFINNWDLVDVSAKHIVGHYLAARSKKPLFRLARSRSLWERRIAILSTFYFIGQGQYSESLEIARALLQDPHDLIHKAVGWMLREIGERDRFLEKSFLKRFYKKMPRTMLRYAIEKFQDRERKAFLKGKI